MPVTLNDGLELTCPIRININWWRSSQKLNIYLVHKGRIKYELETLADVRSILKDYPEEKGYSVIISLEEYLDGEKLAGTD